MAVAPAAVAQHMLSQTTTPLQPLYAIKEVLTAHFIMHDHVPAGFRLHAEALHTLIGPSNPMLACTLTPPVICMLSCSATTAR
jgi:hypothetical protein